ncbi:hypothetical protein HC766_02840 [Candidatus Gracilibacteria bacterium]|nr:hypothetical protein [Candidatus Gracilibacteria bacterium]
MLLKKLYDNLGIEQNIATSDFVEIVKEELGDADAVKKQFEKWINSKIDDLESIGDTNALEQIMDTDESVLNIVLSPCGTSFDIFSNYIERAEFWNENIKKAK